MRRVPPCLWRFFAPSRGLLRTGGGTYGGTGGRGARLNPSASDITRLRFGVGDSACLLLRNGGGGAGDGATDTSPGDGASDTSPGDGASETSPGDGASEGAGEGTADGAWLNPDGDGGTNPTGD